MGNAESADTDSGDYASTYVAGGTTYGMGSAGTGPALTEAQADAATTNICDAASACVTGAAAGAAAAAVTGGGAGAGAVGGCVAGAVQSALTPSSGSTDTGGD